MSGEDGDENDDRGVRIIVSSDEFDERDVEKEADRKAMGVRGDEGDGVEGCVRFRFMLRPSTGRRARMETEAGAGPSGEG